MSFFTTRKAPPEAAPETIRMPLPCWKALIDGPVQIKRAIPTLALIPLLILWFGIGESMKVTTIVLAVIVPIYIHTHNALRSIDSRYVELAETLRMSQKDFILQVVLPGALPGFLLGLRFAVTLCWVSLVVVEQINARFSTILSVLPGIAAKAAFVVRKVTGG